MYTHVLLIRILRQELLILSSLVAGYLLLVLAKVALETVVTWLHEIVRPQVSLVAPYQPSLTHARLTSRARGSRNVILTLTLVPRCAAGFLYLCLYLYSGALRTLLCCRRPRIRRKRRSLT